LELVLAIGLVASVATGGGGPVPGLPTEIVKSETEPAATDAASDVGSTAKATTATTPERLVDRAAVEYSVHKQVNRIRAERDLPRLEFHPGLRDVARYHSRDMARDGYFSHEAPGGESMESRYRTFGVECRLQGENIAQTWYLTDVVTNAGLKHYDSVQELAHGIVDQWMNSSDHRKNILRPGWESQAVGVHAVSDGKQIKVFATQNFCSVSS
jgi:uncharacterized protein YkwD